MTAVSLRRRLGRAVATYGDSFVVSGDSRRALVSRLTAPDIAAYLTEEEASGRPVFAALTPPEDPTNAEDEVAWQGATYSVAKVVESRYRGEVVARLLIWVREP